MVKRRSYSSLRAYLVDTDTNQEQLATRLGISQPFLSMLLSGQRKPSVDLALRIEAETGVSVRAQVEGSAA